MHSIIDLWFALRAQVVRLFKAIGPELRPICFNFTIYIDVIEAHRYAIPVQIRSRLVTEESCDALLNRVMHLTVKFMLYKVTMLIHKDNRLNAKTVSFVTGFYRFCALLWTKNCNKNAKHVPSSDTIQSMPSSHHKNQSFLRKKI